MPRQVIPHIHKSLLAHRAGFLIAGDSPAFPGSGGSVLVSINVSSVTPFSIDEPRAAELRRRRCQFERLNSIDKDPVMHRECPLDCKVYVGNLGNNGNKTELERAFGYYGPLRSVWVARNPPGFAFVEFEDPRDATDAVRELDGRTLCGCRVRVELSNGEKRNRNRGAPPSWSRRIRDRDDYRRRSPPPRRRAATMPLLTTL
uniref:Serine/arginine-rich splicing factor 3 n=1 Tax=Kryptolebias marmoratus TaxID=37003 RepID=A0A3Q3BFN4_KRYMA